MKNSRRSRKLDALSVTRRAFLGGAAAATAMPLFARSLPWQENAKRPVLVYIFLRGGMDGLTACVPYAEDDLYKARPTLAIAPPGKPGGAIDLDGHFGLAPTTARLLTPFKNGHLAFVHASGSINPTRSHFKAMRHMELGFMELPLQVNTGWITRHLRSSAPPEGGGDLRAIALGLGLPNSLAKGPGSLSVTDPEAMRFPGDPSSAALRRKYLERMCERAGEPTGPAGKRTLMAIDRLGKLDFRGYRPEGKAVYPDTDLGRKLRTAAILIKGGLGLECIHCDRGEFDHHRGMGPHDGNLARLLTELTGALEAFYLDMQDQMDNLLLVVQSEFGRKVPENASAGTDHGAGNVMILMGGGLAGGKVHTKWPTLAPEKWDDRALAVTIDYRDVMSELLSKRLGNKNITEIFPNYKPAEHSLVV